MTKKKQHISKTDYFDLISNDLVINILSRLPFKSLAQCRCVLKPWSTVITRPNYDRLFPIKSSATPWFLFGLEVGSNLFFYSSLQPQNPEQNSSVVATRHYTNLGIGFYRLCRQVCGLVCSQHIGKNDSWAVISNPITGETVTTPKVSIYRNVRSQSTKARAEYSFGYDTIEKQFKVLRITWLSSKSDNWFDKYHVLTLGTGDGNLLWKKIQCCTPHYPLEDNNGICINGILFYPAMDNNKIHTMVCFDVRFEKFSFFNIDTELARKMRRPFSLIDYKGKLGVNCYILNFSYYKLWVLEDVEKHIWSKHLYRVPGPRMNSTNYVCLAGMIGSGEFLLSQRYTQNPFFVFYYNLEKKVGTKV